MGPEGPGVREAQAAHVYRALLCESPVARVFLDLLFCPASQDGLCHLVGLEVLGTDSRHSWARLGVLVSLLGDEAKGVGNPNSCPRPHGDGFWLHVLTVKEAAREQPEG